MPPRISTLIRSFCVFLLVGSQSVYLGSKKIKSAVVYSIFILIKKNGISFPASRNYSTYNI